jgi:predicted Zn-dependent peptidase
MKSNMGRKMVVVLALAWLLMTSAARAQRLQIPPHEKVVLKNGLTVLLMAKRGVPLVNVAGIVKAGAVADPAGQEGLAATTAALLRKGTKPRTAQQFSADIDYIGGGFNAGATEDYTSLSAEFLSKDEARGLELFADALLHPTFPKEEVDKLLAQSVDEAKSAKDNPRSVILDYYDGYLYGGKGYGRPTDGDEVTLKKVRREAVQQFYEMHYTPGNTIIAVAGDFNAAEMKKNIEKTFGGWPAKAAPSEKMDTAGEVKGRRLLLVNKTDATQTFFTIGNVGIAANDPDRVAIRVVNTIFGLQFTSMLNEALRVESGLTYGAESFFRLWKELGPFVIYSFTKNETTAQAIDLALEVLKKLHRDGLTADQLAAAKRYIKGQFPPTIETSAQLARLIASNEFYGLDDSEVNQLESRVDAVSLDMTKQVIAKHFPQENLVFVLIGKATEIGPAVKKYAEKQDARDITAPGYWPGSK